MSLTFTGGDALRAAIITAVGAALIIAMGMTFAHAKPVHRAHHHAARHHVAHNHHHRTRVAYHDGRPSAWCGWWLRHQVGSDPGAAFNLARNWAHWGHPASGPGPGVIGVMPHHVFKVVQVLGPRTVLAISGNDGHAVRTRPRSIAGVIAWRSS